MLAVRWLSPGQEVTIDTRYLDCEDSIRVRTRDEEILEVDPETAVGYMPSPFARSRAGSGGLQLKPYESPPVGGACEAVAA